MLSTSPIDPSKAPTKVLDAAAGPSKLAETLAKQDGALLGVRGTQRSRGGSDLSNQVCTLWVFISISLLVILI